MALITTAQLKERLPAYTGTDQDALHTKLAARADQAMALWCGFPLPDSGGRHTFEQATYTRHLDGPRYTQPRALFVGVRPLISVTSVHQDSSWDYGASTEVPAADREDDLAAGVLWMRPSAGGWIRYPRAIKVVVEAGFATPLDDGHLIVDLCAQVVKYLIDRPQVAGKLSTSGRGQTVQMADVDAALPAAVKDALSGFQLGSACAA